jgi:transcriptional regulator with XRE-family HTH domain
MNICSVVATNIRKLRASKKLSQDELAADAGVDRSYISEIESGYKNPSILVLDRIATALDVKITALFSGYKSN